MSAIVDFKGELKNYALDARGEYAPKKLEAIIRAYRRGALSDASDEVFSVLIREARAEKLAEIEARVKPAAVEVVPDLSRFDALVKQSGWVEADGPEPGIFERNDPGSVCLWACRWTTSAGVRDANFYLPVENMSLSQLVWELKDAAIFVRDIAKNQKVGRFIARLESGNPGSTDEIRSFLRDLRLMYPEYLAPWDLPRTIFLYRWRRGFEPSDKVVTSDFNVPEFLGLPPNG
jgi:hypothetical protein